MAGNNLSWRALLLAVAVALAITSALLAILGHTRIWRTILRSVIIGFAAMASSYVVGALLLG